MLDRIPTTGQEGRVLVTPENGGAPFYAKIQMADNPTQEGTPLNKNSLLKDATAALFGLGANAVPDDVLSEIKTLIANNTTLANTKAEIATGSYTGTGTYGASNPNSLTFAFAPKLLMLFNEEFRLDKFHANYFNPIDTNLAIRPLFGVTSSFTKLSSGVPFDSLKATIHFTSGNRAGVDVNGYTKIVNNTLSWYVELAKVESGVSYYGLEHLQFNESGKTYYYVAIG